MTHPSLAPKETVTFRFKIPQLWKNDCGIRVLIGSIGDEDFSFYSKWIITTLTL